jgi:zinc transport system substrate-binding protein
MTGSAWRRTTLATLSTVVASVTLAAPPTVVVSILPQRDIVQRLAGDRVTVEVLVRPGASPATYSPTPQQVARLVDARLWIRIGVLFESAFAPRLHDLAPDLDVVDGRKAIELEPAESGHDHGGGIDPHLWLDPERLAGHAGVVCDALCRLLPESCPDFRSRLDELDNELAALDRRIGLKLAPFAGRAIFVFHPAYGYFTRRYHLTQVAVETEGGEPSARRLAELVDAARRDHITTVFVQPQYAGRGAQALAEALGGRVVEIDPLAPDVVANLDRIADRIATSFKETQ